MPVELERVFRVSPVVSLVRVTWAPRMLAPLESRTTPTMVPELSWASRREARASERRESLRMAGTISYIDEDLVGGMMSYSVMIPRANI